MGDIKPGFYFAKAAKQPTVLVLAEYDEDGVLKIQDHFGGLYGENNLMVAMKREPLTPEEVKTIIQFDEMKIDFVHKGLERLADSEKHTVASGTIEGEVNPAELGDHHGCQVGGED